MEDEGVIKGAFSGATCMPLAKTANCWDQSWIPDVLWINSATIQSGAAATGLISD